MRRYIGYIGLALALLVPAAAKTQVFDQRTFPMAVAWDMDGEAADADQVITGTPIVDMDGSTSYTISGAQPDTCRLIDVTFQDADSSITAGTLTVVGTDCYGDNLTATYTMSSPIGGVQTLTVGTASTAASDNLASGAYFATITSIATGTVTGEGGAADTFIVGYSGTGSQYGYPMYGHLEYTRSDPPYRQVNIGVWKEGGRGSVITNSGTTWTATGGIGFIGLAANDLVQIRDEGGNTRTVQVATYTSQTSIVVSEAVTLPAAGQGQQIGFHYQKFLQSTDPQDGWFNVEGFDAAFFVFDVDAVAASTGLESRFQCVPGDIDKDAAITVDSDAVLTGATGNAVSSVDLRLAPAYSWCRFGVTYTPVGGDDADTADEDINIYLGMRR